LSREFRVNKKYDDLLRVYELILPHKPGDTNLIKDVCILYLRKQDPDSAIRTMERNKVDAEPDFTNLYDKAQQMKEALRRQGGRT